MQFYFAANKTDLPRSAARDLKRIIDFGRKDPQAKIGISGYHDRRGNAEANLSLARRRARAARDLIASAGVPADRIVMVRPQATVGGDNDRLARRVDIYPIR